MNAHPILLQKKYVKVILAFAKLVSISPREALDFFYQSQIYEEMSVGVSDMHCRDENYLAEELKAEFDEKSHGSVGTQFK